MGIIGLGRVDDPLLPRWVAHHAEQVGADRLLLLLWGGQGTVRDLGCATHVMPVGAPDDEAARWRAANRFADGLLSAYDYVAALDVSDFLVDTVTAVAAIAGPRQPDVLGGRVVGAAVTPGEAVACRPLLPDRLPGADAPVRPVLRSVEADWAAGGRTIEARVVTSDDLLLLRVGDL